MLYLRVSPMTRFCWSWRRSRLESTACIKPFMFQETTRRPLGPSQGNVVEQGPDGGGGGLRAALSTSPAIPGLKGAEGNRETAGGGQEVNATPSASPKAAPVTSHAVVEESAACGGTTRGKAASKGRGAPSSVTTEAAKAVEETASAVVRYIPEVNSLRRSPGTSRRPSNAMEAPRS